MVSEQKTLQAEPNDRLVCVVLGDDESRNERLFVGAIRMPKTRFAIIGSKQAYMHTFLDVAGQSAVEFWPQETPVPSGENTMVFDGRR